LLHFPIYMYCTYIQAGKVRNIIKYVYKIIQTKVGASFDPGEFVINARIMIHG